ncbi:nuclease domain-containing protein [Burkholderia plantarii]|uniref:Phage protein gp74 n=1 Tax=Burkholderia plantarii TaxID=41899 RepID=A0A0B6RS35_BURPL|nr:nuclease domain-containing protein [Burkholderia plantarii]AJK46203.1 phage protein gp74 [Burkholderia plantarii]
MKRSTPLQRKKPLNRGSWSRKNAPLPEQSPQRKRMNSRPRRPTVAEGSKYLDACRGEPCYLQVPGVCRLNPQDRTVVPCHSNQSRHGKAGALKAKNEFTVPGCTACHAWIDQNRVGTPRQEKFDVWDAAFAAWEPVRARKMGREAVCAL